MQTKERTYYICDICGSSYYTEEQCLLCESKPKTHDKGVRVGDVVKVTAGDGSGKFAQVTDVGVCDKEYGHYQWEKYWHTVYLHAKLIDDVGSRMLLFDSYDVWDGS